MVQIIPAVLANSLAQYQDDLSKIKKSQTLKNGWVHIDLADGEFVQNKTIRLSEIPKVPTDLKMEAHLMVEDPCNWLDKLADLGFKRVLFHIESGEDIRQCIGRIKEKGMEAGLVFKHGFELKNLEQYLPDIDMVLLMSVVPGFQGQPFIPEVFQNVKKLVSLRDSKGYNFKIAMDGGLNNSNAKEAISAGADYLIMGSYLLKSENMDEQVESVWEAMNG